MGAPPAASFNYYYPNDQSARMVWYHDHAVGITRLNAYAGLASAYIIRDLSEAALIAAGAIPSREIPLIIQDKTFKSVPDAWGQPGDLWYPSEYEPGNLGPATLPLPYPSCVPEFFGDTMLV
jgi:spore coat protein A